MSLIFRYLKKYRRFIVFSVTLKTAATFIELLLPYILKHLIDDVVPTRNLPLVFIWGAVMLVIAVFIRFLNVWSNRRAVKTSADAAYCAEKIAGLRVFEDENDKMNLSIKDVNGGVLMVSQFTLLADARHGRRPSFIKAARPEQAEPLFEECCQRVRDLGIHVETGRFRTHMEVALINDGPVTILLDSKKTF